MIGKLKITTLVDNHALIGSKYWAEHGLSFLIEADGEKILFDTGQTGEVIAHNLERFNEDLSDLKHVVLSHGHYDHTGGLEEIAKRTDNTTVYAHPDIFYDKYVKRDKKYKPIGIPFEEDELKNSFKFNLKKKGAEIIGSVRTTGQIPRITKFEGVPKRFYIKKNNRYINDDISDDQALVLSTRNGIMVILGCTHSGIVNTLYHIKKITGKKDIFGLIGGIHLWSAKEGQLQKTAKVIKEFKPRFIGLSHCSGINTFNYFSKVFGEKVFLNSAGSVFEI